MRSRGSLLLAVFAVSLAALFLPGGVQAQTWYTLVDCDEVSAYKKPAEVRTEPFPPKYRSLCQKQLAQAKTAQATPLTLIKDFPECAPILRDNAKITCIRASLGVKMFEEAIAVVIAHPDIVMGPAEKQCVTIDDPPPPHEICVDVPPSATQQSRDAWVELFVAMYEIYTNAGFTLNDMAWEGTLGQSAGTDAGDAPTDSNQYKTESAAVSALAQWLIMTSGRDGPCAEAHKAVVYGGLGVSESDDEEAKKESSECLAALKEGLPKLVGALSGVIAPVESGCPPGSPAGVYCAANPLTTTEVPVVIGRIINAALGLLGSIALLMFIYGGVTWVTAYGATEKIQKGKDIMTWAIVGILLIFGSFALVRFVLGAFTRL